MKWMKLLTLATLMILTIVLVSCSHTKPNHKFDVQKCGPKICMPKEDFKLFYDAYLEYYNIKEVK